MRSSAVALTLAAIFHFVLAALLWRWSLPFLDRVGLPAPTPEWWNGVVAAALVAVGFNQLAVAASHSRVGIMATAVGQVSAGLMLAGLAYLNDRWQLAAVAVWEMLLALWAFTGLLGQSRATTTTTSG